MSITRRTWLAAGSAIMLACLIPATPTAQALTPAFSSIVVDVSHMRAIGSGPYADIVQAAMTDELNRVFADRIGGRGNPRLVVRVRSLFLTASGPSGSSRGHSHSTDSIEGEALIIGARGEVLAGYPQTNNLAPVGSWYAPLNERVRADAVARNYAQWLRRYTLR
jgi:hypothetical protein